MNNKIYLASPHMSDEGYEMEYIQEAFDTNWIAPLGKNVNEFEKEFAKKTGSAAAAALSSGSSAIHLALKSAGVSKDDIVFCQSLTFSATANPIIYQNAVPVFIDSEENTWNMSPKALEAAFEKYPQAKAVLAVHLYGICADIEEISRICKKHNAILIEDAAESLGSTIGDKYTGTFGALGAFSFNGNKIITTSGGGMVVANDETAQERIEKIRFWSTQSREKKRYYEHKELGYNYRMSNIVAGIGRGQLKVLDKRVEKKRYIFGFYKNAFKDIEEIKMMPADKIGKSNCWLSCITLSGKVKPLDIILALEEKNIESRPIWKPMHTQPFFKGYDFITLDEDKALSEKIFENGVCLPSDTKLTDDELSLICETVKRCFI